MLEENTNTDIVIEQKESIKLIKNTKGFNWEIKLISKELTNSDLERLAILNTNLELTYKEHLVEGNK